MPRGFNLYSREKSRVLYGDAEERSQTARAATHVEGNIRFQEEVNIKKQKKTRSAGGREEGINIKKKSTSRRRRQG